MDDELNHFYERSCKGKVVYDDAASALTTCVTMKRKRGENVWAYRCHFNSEHFHTGHSHPLIRAFIRDLVGLPQPRGERLTYTLADTLSGALVKKLLPRT